MSIEDAGVRGHRVCSPKRQIERLIVRRALAMRSPAWRRSARATCAILMLLCSWGVLLNLSAVWSMKFARSNRPICGATSPSPS